MKLRNIILGISVAALIGLTSCGGEWIATTGSGVSNLYYGDYAPSYYNGNYWPGGYAPNGNYYPAGYYPAGYYPGNLLPGSYYPGYGPGWNAGAVPPPPLVSRPVVPVRPSAGRPVATPSGARPAVTPSQPSGGRPAVTPSGLPTATPSGLPTATPIVEAPSTPSSGRR